MAAIRKAQKQQRVRTSKLVTSTIFFAKMKSGCLLKIRVDPILGRGFLGPFVSL